MTSHRQNEKPPGSAPSVWPIGLAVGVAVLLVGLVIDLRVVAPLGGAITLAFGFLWWLRSLASTQAAPAKLESPATVVTRRDGRRPEAERMARDRFLKRATIGLGGLVAAAIALPAAGFAVLPALQAPRRRAIDLGPIGAFPEGAYVVTTFLSDPQQGEVSRRSAYVRNNGLLGRVPSFTIMSSRCTHVGCPTQPNGLVQFDRKRSERTAGGAVALVPTLGASGFGCPCHLSQFDTEGNRTSGPAPRALDRYEFSILNGRLSLGRLYSVSRVDGSGATARIHAFSLLGDGQPAVGPESLLYPLQPPQ